MAALVPVLITATFAGAFALAAGTIAAAIAPQWRRIARLAVGYVEPAPEVTT